MGLFHHTTTTTDLGSAATSTSAATGTAAAAASSPTATLIDGLTCGNYGTPDPVTGTMTYHTLITIIAGVCAALALVICCFLALTHLFKFRRPDEQKQLVRIIWTPFIVGVASFFGVWFYGAAGYVKPLGEWYELFALISIFYLMIHSVAPAEADGKHPFYKLDAIAQAYNADMGNLNKTWVMVLQILVVRTITMIVQLATYGSECKLLQHKSKVQTIIGVINTLSTVVCFMALLRTHKILKPALANYKIMLKLLSLKVIVGLDVIQTFIFSILANDGDIKPTSTLTLPDLLIGTQNFILCVECFIISIIFIFAYNSRPYSASNSEGNSAESQHNKGPKRNFFVALFDCLNIFDILSGLFFCFQAWAGRRGAPPMETYAQGNQYKNNQAYAGVNDTEYDTAYYGRQ